MSRNTRKDKYSQHFLRSPKIALMLVGHTNIKKSDFTLDIGAGSGVFTYALSKKSKQVLAIEADKQTASKLRKNMQNFENVKIEETDFIDFDLNSLPENYKVCSNIPFHLSSDILKKLMNSQNQPASVYLILQKQFAKKLTSGGRGFTSTLGAQIFPFYTAKIKRPLQKTDFTPPPAVDTVFFELKRRQSPLVLNKRKYLRMVEQSFLSPEYFSKLKKSLHTIGLKPSELTGEEWLEIFTELNGR